MPVFHAFAPHPSFLRRTALGRLDTAQKPSRYLVLRDGRQVQSALNWAEQAGQSHCSRLTKIASWQAAREGASSLAPSRGAANRRIQRSIHEGQPLCSTTSGDVPENSGAIARKNPERRIMNSISIDNPSTVDRFGRVRFARRVLDTIMRVEAERSGAVIGLEGNWGSGKTHVLKKLESVTQELPDAAKPILIHFNPWMVSGARDLVNALLVQMAADVSTVVPAPSIRKRRWPWQRKTVSAGASVARSLLRYVGLLGKLKDLSWAAEFVVPGAGLMVAATGHAAEKASAATESLKPELERLARAPAALSLYGLRQEISEQLRGLDRRVVVLVDDVDRLPPIELAAMIQAIKAVADFPTVVYLLAYDPKIVAKALEAALGVPDGAAFLEKIVHLPIRVPELPAKLFHDFAASRIDSVFDHQALDPKEASDLVAAIRLAAAMLQTPRDVERLRTKLLLVAPLMMGQVNMADMLLLEAIEQRRPRVIRWMAANVDILMNHGLHGYDEDLQSRGTLGDSSSFYGRLGHEEDEELKLRLNAWTKELSTDEVGVHTTMRAAIEFLFDRCNEHSSGVERSRYRRCQNFRFWYRWRCLDESGDLFSAPEIAQLVATPEGIEHSRVFRDAEMFADFCAHVCDLGADDLPPGNAVEFSRAFVKAEGMFGSKAIMNHGFGYGPMSALFHVLALADVESCTDATSEIVENATVWLSSIVLMRARADGEKVRRGDKSIEDALVLHEDRASTLIQAWIERAVCAVQDDSWRTDDQDHSVHALLSYAISFGFDASQASLLMRQAVHTGRLTLWECFSDLRDTAGMHAFPKGLRHDLMPPVEELLVLIESDSQFQGSHKWFVDHLRSLASEFPPVAVPAPNPH